MRHPPPRDDRELDVIVLGEINPDIVVSDPDPAPRFGQQERIVESITMTIGSSSAIAACGAARLGLRVAMVGVVGDDAFGRFMLDALAEQGIETTACRVEEGTPTGATVILTNATDRAILTVLGTIAAASATDVSDDLLSRARHIHVGSFFLQERLAAEVPDLFRRAHAAGLTTSLDPNDDPRDTWNSGLAAALGETDLFLPNLREICGVGRHDDPTIAAQQLVGRIATPPVTAVKMGADGALAVTPDGQVARTAAYPIVPMDAIGAGDSFDAGFLAGWLDGAAIGDCLRMGAVGGALSTRATGGTAAQPTRAELDQGLAGWQ